MIVIIAVMASATGSIVEQTLGLNYWVGVAAITIVVGVLNFFGARLIERFETYGTIALYIGYIIFAIIVISNNHQNMSQVFATGDTSFVPNTTAPAILWSGVLYCAYNLVVVPSSFFTIKKTDQNKRVHYQRYYRWYFNDNSLVFNLLCCNVFLS